MVEFNGTIIAGASQGMGVPSFWDFAVVTSGPPSGAVTPNAMGKTKHADCAKQIQGIYLLYSNMAMDHPDIIYIYIYIYIHLNLYYKYICYVYIYIYLFIYT